MYFFQTMDELKSILFHEEILVFVLNLYIVKTLISFYIHLLILDLMEKLIIRQGQLHRFNLDLENKKVEDRLIVSIIKHPYNNSLQGMYDQF